MDLHIHLTEALPLAMKFPKLTDSVQLLTVLSHALLPSLIKGENKTGKI